MKGIRAIWNIAAMIVTASLVTPVPLGGFGNQNQLTFEKTEDMLPLPRVPAVPHQISVQRQVYPSEKHLSGAGYPQPDRKYAPFGKVSSAPRIPYSERAVKVRVPFIENQGQVENEAVRFYARTFGGTLFVEDGGIITYSLPAEDGKGVAIREFLSDREGVKPVGIEPSPTKVSYFIGNDSEKWRSSLPTCNAVSLGEAFEGISLSLKAYGNNVEKIFTVERGAKPEVIKVRVEGAEGLRVNENGELELKTEVGVVRFTKPVAYQERDGRREEVEAAYTVYDRETYGFATGSYDRTRPLVIDPLLASTFIGGSDRDCALAVAFDSSDNVYVAGVTESSNYPTVAGAYGTSHNGNRDVFVSRLNSDLSTLSTSTFIGGSHEDCASTLALDSSGNLNVAGYTYSSDYPTTSGAYDVSHNGYYDVFVSKLNSDLSSLLASTFIGGSSYNYDSAGALAFDSSGNLYVAGSTYSSDYPTTSGAYDESHNGYYDVFVSKLDSDLSSLLASTFIGGSSDDKASSIALDSYGNVYVAGGRTYSSDYPTTSGAYDESHNGSNDIFVSKLDSDLSNLLASTFIGGSNTDCASGFALDSSGNVYVAGDTRSSNYPTTAGAYDTSYNGGLYDVFVSKLNSDLDILLSSTFIGGSSYDEGWAFALDTSDNVYVTGRTYSSNYPTNAGAYDTSHNGDYDVFISKLNSDLSTLSASTFIGGSSYEDARAIALDSSGNVYVAGETESSNYPAYSTTGGAYDTSHNGGYDVFVSKLDGELSANPSSVVTVTGTDISPGGVSPGTGNVAMEKLSLATDTDYAIWTVVRVDNRVTTGTVAGSDIAEMKVYKDNGDGNFDPSTDTLIGESTVTEDGSGGYAEINIADQTITTTSQDYFIVYDIAPGADPSHSAGARLANSSYITVISPATLSSSGFPIQSGDCALPVTLSSFTAQAGDGQVTLRWVTESEIDNLGFNIYRSFEKAWDYTKINGELIKGAGTSTAAHTYSYTDKRLTNGTTYWHKLEDVSLGGKTTAHGPISTTPQAPAKPEPAPTPTVYNLAQSYPNPFNATATIRYQLPEGSLVSLRIYNLFGQAIRTLVEEEKPAGYYTAGWDSHDSSGRAVASGIYFCRLETKSFVQTRKIGLIR